MSGEFKASAITNFASGAAAGVAQVVVGFPFDTIKGMQAFQRKWTSVSTALYLRLMEHYMSVTPVNMQVGNSVGGVARVAPVGPIQCLRDIVAKEVCRITHFTASVACIHIVSFPKCSR